MLDALQRSVALKACRAYRTVLHSALILARLPPDIRVREAARLYEVKRGSESGTSVPTGAREARGLPRNAASRAHPELGFESVEDLDPSTVDRRHCRAAHIYRRHAKTSGISLEGRKCAYSGRAHAGTTGNERADELARNAALKRKRQRITIAIRCRTPKGDQGGEPGVATALHRGRHCANPNGTRRIAQYLNRFKLKDSPYCACAPIRSKMYCTFSKNAQSSGESAETEAGTGVVVARHGFPALLTTKQRGKHFEFCERVTRRINRVDCWKLSGPENVVKAGRKGVIVQIRERRKTELTPPSEKAPQNSGRAGTSAAATASVKTKAASERKSAPLTISPPKLLVEVEPMDKIAALGKETDAEVFTAIQAVGDFARRASLKEEIGRPSLSGVGGPRPSDLSGNSAVRVPGSTPVGVHPINRVASAIGNLAVGRRASSKVSKYQERLKNRLS
ncbi:hypothetical protein EVAR_48134_1 [Eumeta japonica]|uniref:Uncharacterized protein n=1 Tax=Eumeta variegata TaxID=151549 RepID=A0A4C2A6G2_EUMVA|nr:hypothetical protein EVAR_48134_1 [Eumeta japonica]